MSEQAIKANPVSSKAPSVDSSVQSQQQVASSLQPLSAQGSLLTLMSPANLVSLQRTIGNRAVNQMLTKQRTPHEPVGTIQRTIIADDNPGEYTDEDSGTEYAFIMASMQTKKLWLFANRADLTALRNKIMELEGDFINTEGERIFTSTIKNALKTKDENIDRAFRKKYGATNPGSLGKRALNGLNIEDVEKDWNSMRDDYLDNASTFDPYNHEVITMLYGMDFALVDDEDEVYFTDGKDPSVEPILFQVSNALTGNNWGKLTPKKKGFGERSAKAVGKLYINTDNGGSENDAYTQLTDAVKGTDTKYKDIQTIPLDDANYQIQLLAAGNAANVLSQKTKDKYFYTSQATRTDKTQTDGANYLANKKKYNDTNAMNTAKPTLSTSYNKLKENRDLQDWQEVKNPGNRGGTQSAAMDDWNALAAAAYAKDVEGTANGIDINQDFEWLHIKGVQNGGRNLISNLGAGTWKANSAMIPYENMIRSWGNKPGKVEARYESESYGANDPVLKTITIKVAADADHEIGPIERTDPLIVKFNAQDGTLQDTFTNKFNMAGYKRQVERRKKYNSIFNEIKANADAGAIAVRIEDLFKFAPKRAAKLLGSLDQLQAGVYTLPLADATLKACIELITAGSIAGLNAWNAAKLLSWLSNNQRNYVLQNASPQRVLGIIAAAVANGQAAAAMGWIHTFNLVGQLTILKAVQPAEAINLLQSVPHATHTALFDHAVTFGDVLAVQTWINAYLINDQQAIIQAVTGQNASEVLQALTPQNIANFLQPIPAITCADILQHYTPQNTASILDFMVAIDCQAILDNFQIAYMGQVYPLLALITQQNLQGLRVVIPKRKASRDANNGDGKKKHL